MNSFLYVGTNEGSAGGGIYCALFDREKGLINNFRMAARLEKAGFLAVHPSGNRIYSIGMDDTGETPRGCVAGYDVNRESGALELLNKIRTGTELPVFITITSDGKFLASVCYTSAAGSLFYLSEEGMLQPSGKLHTFTGSGVNPKRQTRSYPHSISLDPLNKFLFVCDLGADAIVRFLLNRQTGEMEPSGTVVKSSQPGAGPRHMCFTNDNKWAYVVNELNNTVSAYAYDPGNGNLRLHQEITTLPDPALNWEKQLAAEIRLLPGDDFLYVSNRSVGGNGYDGIMIYKRDSRNGKLGATEWVETGRHPRHFNIDREGRWLAVSARDSDTVQLYGIDRKNGSLKTCGDPLFLNQPMNIQFII